MLRFSSSGQHASETGRHRRRSAFRTVALVGVLSLVVAACGGDPSPATTTTPGTDPPPTTATTVRVVATTTIVGDIVRGVTGDAATVEVVMPPGADPHDFVPSSRQVALMQEADLVVAVGLELEEGLVAVLHAVADAGTPVLELAALLDPIPFGSVGHHHGNEHDDHAHGHEEDDHGHEDDDHGHGHEDDDHRHEDDDHGHGHEDDDHRHDDGHGHDHGDEDPHFWMDPLRVGRAALLVAEALTAIEPGVDWTAAAEAYAAQMQRIDEEVQAILDGVPESRRLLVTNHDALGYFAHRYGFEVVGTVIPGGTTLGAPSPAELARLVDLIEDLGITAIFAETIDAIALAEAIAREVDHPVAVVVLTTDSLGPPGSDAGTLAGLLLSNARLIAEALG